MAPVAVIMPPGMAARMIVPPVIIEPAVMITGPATGHTVAPILPMVPTFGVVVDPVVHRGSIHDVVDIVKNYDKASERQKIKFIIKL